MSWILEVMHICYLVRAARTRSRVLPTAHSLGENVPLPFLPLRQILELGTIMRLHAGLRGVWRWFLGHGGDPLSQFYRAMAWAGRIYVRDNSRRPLEGVIAELAKAGMHCVAKSENNLNRQ